MRADTESPRLGGFNPCRGLPQLKSFGGLLIDRLPELVVHAGAPDVILDLDVARLDVCGGERRAGERGESAEVGVEKFALDRPAVAQRVFDAATDGPTAAGVALLMACALRSGGQPFGGVDFCPGAAAGHVQKRLVPKPPEVGQAESAACGDEPALLGFRDPERVRPRNRLKLDSLARLVDRGAVALDAEHPCAPLPVAAELAAADEARQVEALGNGGAVAISEVLAVAARSTRACTDIATVPGVGWRRRRCICRCRHRPFGSECRWRCQAQHDQRYASEE